MKLKKIDTELSVCRLKDISSVDISREFVFLSVTDEEISYVCPADAVPPDTEKRDDGWRAFRIEGELDFSLIGILSELSGILAKNKIGIFAVSTYNTDYILVKKENFEKALAALSAAGYEIS